MGKPKNVRQRWIPINLIKKAEELALYIRQEQEKGRLYNYPVNLRGSQLLVMALNLGLQKIAEDVGYISAEPTQNTQKTPPRTDREGKDREFIEKLMGGLG